MTKIKKLSVKRGYDLWSTLYDIIPNTVLETEGDIPLQMLGNVENKKILDAGCGTGRWSVRLAKRGAKVYGIDFSEGMLSQAKKKAEKEKVNIDFISHDLTKRFPFQKRFFDAILCSTVIESIKNIEPVFREFGRTVKKNGILVIMTITPFLRERETARFKIGNIKYLIPVKVHHFFEDYFRWLKENGFILEDVKEPKEKGTKEPLLLILKARKTG